MEDTISRLKRQAKRAENSQNALERLVVEANDAGHSLREIGAAIGKTPEGVRKMIARVRGNTTEAGNG